MMTKTYRTEYNEILELLKYIPLNDYLKIPTEKISFFKEHIDADYKFTFNKSKPINEQNISKNAYIIFTKLYRDYIATESEKIKINEILELNSMKNEQSKMVSYNSEEIFKKKDNEQKNSNVSIVEYKEPLLIRIINKIKSFIFS